MANAPALLRPAEACEQLNVTLKTLYSLIDRKELKAVRLGPRSLRIHADSVKALIENGVKDA